MSSHNPLVSLPMIPPCGPLMWPPFNPPMSPGSTTASLLSSGEWGQFFQHRGEGVVEDPAGGSWVLYSSLFLWQLSVADLSRFPQPPPGRGSGICG